MRAQEWPGRARTELSGKKEALGDAKVDLDERVRELASLERDLEKADFDARAKAHESKVRRKIMVAVLSFPGNSHQACPSLARCVMQSPAG